ncbi:MAG TPA: hypothetical protein VGK94_04950 [Candidatus Polarisedimenticolia bacterium]|jgi:dolichol kinase
MSEVKPGRKLFRMVGLLFPLLYLLGDAAGSGYGWITVSSLLVLLLAFMIGLEYARFRRPGVNRWLFERFGAFTKEKERTRASSTTLYLLSCLLSVLLFNKGVAIASMLCLLFGDPVAELVGTRWGRTPIMGKSVEGTLAGLAACLLATAPLAAAPLGLSIAVVLCGAVAATLFELLPLPVDDNFSIPLGAGAVMTVVQAAGVGGDGGRLILSPLLEELLRAGGT